MMWRNLSITETKSSAYSLALFYLLSSVDANNWDKLWIWYLSIASNDTFDGQLCADNLLAWLELLFPAKGDKFIKKGKKQSKVVRMQSMRILAACIDCHY